MFIDVDFDTDLDEQILVRFWAHGSADSLVLEFKEGNCLVFDAGDRAVPIHVQKIKAEDLVAWGYYEHAENLARIKWQEMAGVLFR